MLAPVKAISGVGTDSGDQSAADALVRELDVKADDLVVYLRRFGGDDPDLPRPLSVTPL
jgi:hypothetical protein